MKKRILVVGDAMLDRYVIGEAERVCPEAPCCVVRKKADEERPGGAAAVAWTVAGLGFSSVLLTRWGADDGGFVLSSILRQAGVECKGERARNTVVKTRICAQSQGHGLHQIVRVDDEPQPETDEKRRIEADRLAGLLDLLLQTHDAAPFAAVLVADYGKGVVTDRVFATLALFAEKHGLPLVVDPARGRPGEFYCGASLVKMNRTEAAEWFGCDPTAEAIRAFVGGKAEDDGLAYLVTLDGDGATFGRPMDPDERFHDPSVAHAPTRCRGPLDVTGAGDAVLAAVGCWLTRQPGGGRSLLDIDPAKLLSVAMRAAAAKCRAFGVVQIPADVLDDERPLHDAWGRVGRVHEAAALAADFRRRDPSRPSTIAVAPGCFDCLHSGHLRTLERAKREADFLIVLLNSDASVRRIKGDSRPLQPETTRAAVLASLAIVDAVIVFEGDTPADALREIRPDVLVKGGDYQGKDIAGGEFVAEYGGRVVVASFLDGCSTTRTARSAERVAVELPTTGEPFPLTVRELSALVGRFPTIDVPLAVESMKRHLEQHPTARRSPGGTRDSVVRWLGLTAAGMKAGDEAQS